MSVQLPNGALVAIAATYDTAVSVTAITNADPGEATSGTQSYAQGDILEVSSDWSRLDGRAVRVGASPTTTTFALDGIDTTLTTDYPAGNGAGSVRKVLTWTPLSQILTSTSSGGDQQFVQYQFLDSDTEKQIPTFKKAAQIALTIADDPTQAGYILASAANDDRLPRIVSVTLPSGSVLYYNCYISLVPIPSLDVNKVMDVAVTLSLLAAPTRYAS